MRSHIAIYAFALLAPLVFAAPSFALSVDRDTGMNTDGTAKFADPDEQMPNFMTGGLPEDQAPAHATPSIGLPVSPDSTPHMNFSVNHLGMTQQQPDAFDQSYDRK
jgi:hypothetical protein